jgi:maltose alpha-D-glucosyltransferase/alpha-amylase
VQRLAGSVQLTTEAGERFSLAALNEYTPNARNAWDYTREALGRYYERIASGLTEGLTLPELERSPSGLRQRDLPPAVNAVVGTYLDSARLLGVRTAELHHTLAAETENKEFAPEPFTPHYVRGVFQSMRNVTTHNLRRLRKQLKTLSPAVAALAQQVMDREPEILDRYRMLRERRLHARRIRCHGDFDLSQAIYTGKDFVLIDFEGDPALPVSERAIKRSPLRDLAGMVRSFHYAAWTGLHDHVQRGSLAADALHTFEPWARLWYRSVSREFLRAYLATLGTAGPLTQPEEEFMVMLPAYLLNEAMHELGHELAHRPDWLHVPLIGVLNLLDSLNPAAPGAGYRALAQT